MSNSLVKDFLNFIFPNFLNNNVFYEFVYGAHPVAQAFFASLLTWALTALGAACVFILPTKHNKFLDNNIIRKLQSTNYLPSNFCPQSKQRQIMTAASFWSLLQPSIEIAENQMPSSNVLFPVGSGFVLGALFVAITDAFLDRYITQDPAQSISKNKPTENQISNILSTLSSSSSDPQSSRKRILLLIIAVTVHNIPEGLAVGISWGANKIGQKCNTSYEKSLNLALAIAIHNFPEGMLISLPLAGFGMSKWNAFLLGQFSGVVETIAAMIGAAAVVIIEKIVSYALSFAAGAMIYVIFDDIVVEAYKNNNKRVVSASIILGFLVMMCLEVGLEHGHSQNN